MCIAYRNAKLAIRLSRCYRVSAYGLMHTAAFVSHDFSQWPCFLLTYTFNLADMTAELATVALSAQLNCCVSLL